jgi:hypothetical protein
LTIVIGDSYVIRCADGIDPETDECAGGVVNEVRGGFISDTFGKWLGKLVSAAASMLPGSGPPAEAPVVNIDARDCE